jgi:hypothetical protein
MSEEVAHRSSTRPMATVYGSKWRTGIGAEDIQVLA